MIYSEPFMPYMYAYDSCFHLKDDLFWTIYPGYVCSWQLFSFQEIIYSKPFILYIYMYAYGIIFILRDDLFWSVYAVYICCMVVVFISRDDLLRLSSICMLMIVVFKRWSILNLLSSIVGAVFIFLKFCVKYLSTTADHHFRALFCVYLYLLIHIWIVILFSHIPD